MAMRSVGRAELGGELGDRVCDAVAQLAADVEQRRHGSGAVLGLGEQVGRQPVDATVPVGHDQYLARSGESVDAHLAHHLPLGLGHVGVARPHDHVAARHDGRAEGHRGDRLGAADGVQVGDAEQAAGGGDAGGDAAAGRGGEQTTTRPTPATCAGMAVMSTDDG